MSAIFADKKRKLLKSCQQLPTVNMNLRKYQSLQLRTVISRNHTNSIFNIAGQNYK